VRWETQFHAVPPNVIPSTARAWVKRADERARLESEHGKKQPNFLWDFRRARARESKLQRGLEGNELDLEMIYFLFIGSLIY
jgi:hypothetical protein